MTAAPPLRLPLRDPDAHKGDFGRVALIGGSRGMSGSIALSAMAALHTGAGLVNVMVPDKCLETVAGFHPGLMTIPLTDDGTGRFGTDAIKTLDRSLKNASAIGCGPGMTTDRGSVRIVERLLEHESVPRAFDADALNCIAKHSMLETTPDAGELILTPHPGELERLTGVKPDDRSRQIEAAVQFSIDHGLVVVVKGGPTVVAHGGETWTNSTGNPGMATGGSGDVLTGVVTALLAQRLSPWDAARLAVWIHGLAGDLAAKRVGQSGMTALEIVNAIPEATASAMESQTR